MGKRFYFNSRDDRIDLDPEGIELADLEHAQKEALRSLGKILQDAVGDTLWHGKVWEVWVTDAPNGAGHVFFKLQLSATKPTEPT